MWKRTSIFVAVPLAVAGLAGCAVYPAPGYYGTYGESYAAPGQASIYIQGGSGWSRPGYGARDRDRDGVPNRFDRDRDGDGVGNRYDRRPNDPRYR